MSLEINHHVYVHNSRDDVVVKLLRQILKGQENIVLDISNLTAAAEAETSAVNAAIDLLNNLAEMLRDQAADPVAIAAIADQLSNSATDLGAAIVANTPAAEEPAPEPTPPTPEPEPVPEPEPEV